METELATEEFLVELLNIFQVYYRNLYNKDVKENMFDGVDFKNPSSTNRSMELFFEIFHEYKENKSKNENLTKVFEPDEQIFTENIYALLIDDNINKISPCLFSLIIHLGTNNWQDINWKITKIK